jgi:hypothetical protein
LAFIARGCKSKTVYNRKRGKNMSQDDVSDFEMQLVEMANDADIQRELKEIEEDLCQTELDQLIDESWQ